MVLLNSNNVIMKKYQFIIFLCSIFFLGCIVKPEMWGDVKIVPYDLADYEGSSVYEYPNVEEKLDSTNNRVYKDTVCWFYNFIFEGNLKIDSLIIKNQVINFLDTFHFKKGSNGTSNVRIYKTSFFTDKTVKGIDGNIQEDILVVIDYYEGVPILICIHLSESEVVYYNFRYYNQNKRIPKKGYYWLEK
jgi:hypothetical protein